MSGAGSASGTNVTEDDVKQYLAQTVEEYKEACHKGFAGHKFEPVTAGPTIGNHVMTNLIDNLLFILRRYR